MGKVIIVGKGPAGISASLYAKRAGVDTLIIGKDEGALKKAHLIENYYGFENGITGNDLVQIGIKQANNLGCEVIEDEVLSISYSTKYEVKTKSNSYEADAVILATGSERNTPKINGIKEFEGKGVSYCAVCDAFFYRKKDVVVLGSGEYAIHEAKELQAVVNSVTILTNGEDFNFEQPEGIKVDKRKIKSIDGEVTVKKIIFEDDSSIDISGVFVAIGVASSTALARKIGAEINGNNIVVNQNMQTNVPGLYAAGDCTGGWLQISKAVYEGSKAGLEVAKFLRK